MNRTRHQELRSALPTVPVPFPLPGLKWPFPVTVLMLAPHPDDFDAIGVTMKHLKDKGHAIHVACVRSGSGVEDVYCSPPTIEAKAALREAEQRTSCRFFGLPDESLVFMCMEEDEELQPFNNAANRKIVRDQLLTFRPDIVFLPHGNDTNSGHQRMYAMLKSAAGEMDSGVLAFLIKDPKTITMRVDTFLSFGEESAEWKGQLLRCHDSQHQRNLHTRGHGFDDRILDVNRAIASECGMELSYAEAFEIEQIGGRSGV